MSPLDDELRTMLASRADSFHAAPDPLRGIEAKARRIRWGRLTTGVTASALAVTAVVGVVPWLATGRSPTTLLVGAPDASAAPSSSPKNVVGPDNLLGDWPQRGDHAAGPDEAQVLRRFAAAFPSATGAPHYRFLVAGQLPSGLRYTAGQAWFTGSDVAYTVGFSGLDGDPGSTDLFVGKATPRQPAVLAFAPCCGGGPHRYQTIFVIPRPGTSQVLYAQSDNAPFTRVDERDHLVDGVLWMPRPGAPYGADRLELLGSEGTLHAPTFLGPIDPLLEGVRIGDPTPPDPLRPSRVRS